MSTPTDGSPKAHIVTALLRDGDRVLLCHRSPRKLHHPNVWGMPGGHVDPGELPAEALTREIREELGIGIAAPSGPPIQEFHGDTFDMQIWLIETWTGTPVNAAPDEHDAIAWFTGDEVGELSLAHGDKLATLIRSLQLSETP